MKLSLGARHFLGVALAGVLTPSCASQTSAVPTSVAMRDPSTIIKRDNTYWVYGTGKGVRQLSSPDRLHWTEQQPVFATSPAWTREAVPGNTINIMWAPDVRRMNGKYYLYYSFSTLGSNNSAIGLATSATLEPDSWVDQGPVIVSQRGGNFNAIDPCIFQDAGGKPWLSYGSYWSGIKLVALDSQSGKIPPGGRIYEIASRPTPGNAIEAGAIYLHDGYYYLFVNWNGGGAYNIRVGRSQTVTGPYLDKDGKDLQGGGGSLFLNSVFDDRSGKPFDDQTGPGHVGILRDTDGYWVSTHFEWSRFNNGATTMNIHRLIWDVDGWPRVVLDPGPFRLASVLPTYGVLTNAGDAPQNTYFQNTPAQAWRLVHQGAGYYAILNGDAALSVVGTANPAAKTEMLPFQKLDSQLWFPQQNEDGTYTLLLKSSGNKAALDIDGCSNNDGAPVNVYTSNGLPCQKWSFRTR